MKKRFTRILAMVLCVLSIAALLPTAALAADDVDPVKEAAAAVANGMKSVRSVALASNGKTAHTYTIKAKTGDRYKMYDPLHGEWGKQGLSVRYQWYVKKAGSSKWTKIKGATKYYYKFKATMSKNGYRYRLKITNKKDSSDYAYLVWKVKVSK